jgi:hypothetical protein
MEKREGGGISLHAVAIKPGDGQFPALFLCYVLFSMLTEGVFDAFFPCLVELVVGFALVETEKPLKELKPDKCDAHYRDDPPPR